VNARKLPLPMAILLVPALTITAVASAAPTLRTDRGCYLVGQQVKITGAGFAASRAYQVALNGIDFGISTTQADGGFTAALRPGGLGANVVQDVDTLTASDGTSMAQTTLTVTRTTGARILAGRGAAATLRAPFQVWGFALDSGKATAKQPVYVHYVGPHHLLRTTAQLGYTGGQCGYLKTAPRRVFPFIPAPGTWTLQLDSKPTYFSRPPGPVARITVHVS
jgi:hypothetical protein